MGLEFDPMAPPSHASSAFPAALHRLAASGVVKEGARETVLSELRALEGRRFGTSWGLLAEVDRAVGRANEIVPQEHRIWDYDRQQIRIGVARESATMAFPGGVGVQFLLSFGLGYPERDQELDLLDNDGAEGDLPQGYRRRQHEGNQRTGNEESLAHFVTTDDREHDLDTEARDHRDGVHRQEVERPEQCAGQNGAGIV